MSAHTIPFSLYRAVTRDEETTTEPELNDALIERVEAAGTVDTPVTLSTAGDPSGFALRVRLFGGRLG